MKELIDKYYDYLKENTSVREVDGWHVVYLPVYGLFNDNIEVYIKKEGDKIIITDDGYIHRHVHNEMKVQQIVLCYGLSFNKNEIYCECYEEYSFSECLNKLIQAMMSVSFVYLIIKK